MRVTDERVLAGLELDLEALLSRGSDIGRDVDAGAGQMEVVRRGLVVDDEGVAPGGEAVGSVETDVEAGAGTPVQRRAAAGAARVGRRVRARGSGGLVVVAVDVAPVVISSSSPPQPTTARPSRTSRISSAARERVTAPPLESVSREHTPAARDRFTASESALERGLDDRLQLGVGEGLVEQAASSQLDRLGRALRLLRATRHQDHGEIRPACAQLVEELDARHLRHDDVADHEVERLLVEELERMLRRRDPVRLVPAAPQDLDRQLPHDGLVVDDQNSHARTFLGRRSSPPPVAATTASLPSALTSSSIVPLEPLRSSASTRSSTSAQPISPGAATTVASPAVVIVTSCVGRTRSTSAAASTAASPSES